MKRQEILRDRANANRRPRPPLALRWASVTFLGWVSIRGYICGGRDTLLVHADEFRPPPIAPSSSSFEIGSNDAGSLHALINDATSDVAAVDSVPPLPKSSISGYAFFDSLGNGVLDVATSSGIGDVFVGLFVCSDERIDATRTDSSGYYSFDGLHEGEYYVGVSPPRWYAFSDSWNGEANETTGLLLHPGADSAADPSTGRTACLDLGRAEEEAVSFGLRLDYPSNAALSMASATSPPVDEGEENGARLSAIVGAACAVWGEAVLVSAALVLFILHRRKGKRGREGSSDPAGGGPSPNGGLIDKALEGDVVHQLYLD